MSLREPITLVHCEAKLVKLPYADGADMVVTELWPANHRNTSQECPLSLSSAHSGTETHQQPDEAEPPLVAPIPLCTPFQASPESRRNHSPFPQQSLAVTPTRMAHRC